MPRKPRTVRVEGLEPLLELSPEQLEERLRVMRDALMKLGPPNQVLPLLLYLILCELQLSGAPRKAIVLVVERMSEHVWGLKAPS